MPTIAEIAQKSRSDVVAHFLDADATTPEDALTFQPQRHAERRALAYLIGKGIVQLTPDGQHWIDRAAAEAWKRETTTRTALIAGGTLAAVAGLMLWRRHRNRKS